MFFLFHLNLMSKMDLLFFINSFHFIMPILLSLLFIIVLETVLGMIYHIKGWETVQYIKLEKKVSSLFQKQQLQEQRTLTQP